MANKVAGIGIIAMGANSDFGGFGERHHPDQFVDFLCNEWLALQHLVGNVGFRKQFVQHKLAVADVIRIEMHQKKSVQRQPGAFHHIVLEGCIQQKSVGDLQ